MEENNYTSEFSINEEKSKENTIGETATPVSTEITVPESSTRYTIEQAGESPVSRLAPKEGHLTDVSSSFTARNAVPVPSIRCASEQEGKIPVSQLTPIEGHLKDTTLPSSAPAARSVVSMVEGSCGDNDALKLSEKKQSIEKPFTG